MCVAGAIDFIFLQICFEGVGSVAVAGLCVENQHYNVEKMLTKVLIIIANVENVDFYFLL